MAGLSAAGAAALVGGEDDDGVLITAAEDIQQQRAAMDDLIQGGEVQPVAVPTSAPVEFSDDEELIDEAEGFDPTPVEDGSTPATEVVPHDEVVIVSRDDGEPQEQ